MKFKQTVSVCAESGQHLRRIPMERAVQMVRSGQAKRLSAERIEVLKPNPVLHDRWMPPDVMAHGLRIQRRRYHEHTMPASPDLRWPLCVFRAESGLQGNIVKTVFVGPNSAA